MVKFTHGILVFLIVIIKSTSSAITNENIRDAIISVVHMIRSTDDKLAMHETRERTLGETLKRGLIAIEKRQKMMDQGAIGRLDERVAAVETILLQKDERERIQSQKVFDGVNQIQKDMRLLLDQIKSEIVAEISKLPASLHQPVPSSQSIEVLQLKESLVQQFDSLTNKISTLELKIDGSNNELKQNKEETKTQLERLSKQLSSSEELLLKFDNRLSEFDLIRNAIQTQSNSVSDLQTSLLQGFEVQRINMEQILPKITAIAEKLQLIMETSEAKATANETLDILQEIKYEATRAADKLATIIDSKYQETKLDSDDKHEKIEKSITNLNELMENQVLSIENNYDSLRKDVQSLKKVENVMMQTADNVMDVKRLIEYSVHQIILEVAELIKGNFKNTSDFIEGRFTNFELIILDGENGALSNITYKIGKDIDQVWRQIGIMYQQLTANTDTLNKLQNQTDSYVNGSLNTMDSMKGKVGKITERMTEVDENLNYLLGRLSLVTQEFNRIKTGLGQALEDIKSGFVTVQEKINESGHKHHIPDDNNEIHDSDDSSSNGNKTSKRNTN